MSNTDGMDATGLAGLGLYRWILNHLDNIQEGKYHYKNLIVTYYGVGINTTSHIGQLQINKHGVSWGDVWISQKMVRTHLDKALRGMTVRHPSKEELDRFLERSVVDRLSQLYGDWTGILQSTREQGMVFDWDDPEGRYCHGDGSVVDWTYDPEENIFCFAIKG